ncbi:B-cell receptor CD22-like [Eublepharis macularius]|uniref:B-cell receptor CD22-like n=1 Tax=Eublepharis macularius TaxID=481883 RepID=A0AA97KB36_EUBMA|nr:B-cell receptor CD22-like [Eublepharis macularius]
MTSGYNKTKLRDSQDRVKFVGNLNHTEKKTCSLKISQVRTEDNGIYGARLFASHSRPTQQNKWFLKATIHVADPPKGVQLKAFSRTNIREGEKLSLECTIKSSNPNVSEYCWYKDGLLMYECQNRNKIEFVTKGEQHSGTYKCGAKNSVGMEMSEELRIDVQYPPKKVQVNGLPPQGNIKEGARMDLWCSSKGNPPVTHYEWYKDQDADVFRTGQQLQFDSLEFRNADAPKDVRLAIENPQLPIKEEDTLPPKEVKVIQNPGTQIYEGKHVLLGCEVVKANPAVSSYRWYKDGELQKSDPISADLTFSAVTPAHSGRYWCEATNSVATSRSQEIMLNVYYGPRNVLLSLERQATVTEGMDVTLLCAADANPPPTYFELYRDDEKKLEKPDRILILRKVEIEDSGDYHCIAYNKVSGAESQTFTLSVSYSRTTKLKHGLKGLGVILSFIIILGMLIFALKTWKKRSSSGTPRTERSGSFFVRKAKPEVPSRNRANEGAVNPSGFLNEGAEEAVSYAMLRFPRGGSEEEDDYSRVTAPRLALDPSKEEVVYSVIKKPGLLSKGDTKHDYENVVAPKEEELHYSSLVNLAPRPRPTCRDSETDSESEDSIQYAALKH